MNVCEQGQPAGEFSRAEKLRFAVLIALVFAIAAVMWARRDQALKPRAPAPPPASALPAQSAPASPGAQAPLAGMMDPDPVEPYVWNAAEALADARDGSEEPGAKALAYLLHSVRSTPPNAKAFAEASRVTARELSAQSAARRGTWVHVVGAVGAGFYAPEPVAWSGPTGVYRVYANFVFDEEGGAIKVYTVRDEPPVGSGDMVAAHGLYLQTLAYRNRENARLSAPVVVAERLAPYEPLPRESWLTSFGIPGALAAAGALLLVLFARAARRGPPSVGS